MTSHPSPLTRFDRFNAAKKLQLGKSYSPIHPFAHSPALRRFNEAGPIQLQKSTLQLLKSFPRTCSTPFGIKDQLSERC
jgi:hypothetical protein